MDYGANFRENISTDIITIKEEKLWLKDWQE